MSERALVPDPGRCPRDHRKLADRLQPGTPPQLTRLSNPGGISKRKRLCKCGKQRTLPTFAQPRRRRAYLAAKLKPEHSHSGWTNQEDAAHVGFTVVVLLRSLADCRFLGGRRYAS